MAPCIVLAVRYAGTTMGTATEPRVQTGWRIRRELKQWVDVEAAKRQLVPRDVIEQLITAMKELTDSSHHACASLEEAREKECEICLSRMP